MRGRRCCPTCTVEARRRARRAGARTRAIPWPTQGLRQLPGVDTATEMVTLMSATRAYEANVAAMNAARTLALKALEIGGAS